MKEDKSLFLGIKLKQLRMDKNYSLQELAQKTGMAVSYLNEIEKAKKYPRPAKIEALAEALGISVAELTNPTLETNLQPIETLIRSSIFTAMPLEVFGLAKISIVSLFSDKPSKANAFIRTLLELARNYDLTQERFYLAILRAYQEMHENYLPEIEAYADDFRQKWAERWREQQPNAKIFQALLEEVFHYEIQQMNLQKYPDLQGIRSVMRPQQKKYTKSKLWLNPKLSESQKTFALARELGYAFMQIQERVYTSAWTNINSFEELLHSYHASYFAGAVLIPSDKLSHDLTSFFQQKTWQQAHFLAILEHYNASPEMFLHRLVSLVTHLWGVKKLFFLRFMHQKNTQNFVLDKELHLSDLHNPHAINLNEHYCRRWVSINILKELEHNVPQGQTILCRAQISQYYDSPNEYFCISLARNLPNSPELNTSVTIGFLITPELKKTMLFLNDTTILKRQVGVSCERCIAINCQERVAEASRVHSKVQMQKISQALEKLKKE